MLLPTKLYRSYGNFHIWSSGLTKKISRVIRKILIDLEANDIRGMQLNEVTQSFHSLMHLHVPQANVVSQNFEGT